MVDGDVGWGWETIIRRVQANMLPVSLGECIHFHIQLGQVGEGLYRHMFVLVTFHVSGIPGDRHGIDGRPDSIDKIKVLVVGV